MTAFHVSANLALDHYSDLISAINDWLDRSDLTGVAPQMIALAETRINRELMPYFEETLASVVTLDGLGALPSDFGRINRVTYDGYALPQLSTAAATTVPTSGTQPVAYTLEQGQIRVWPAGNFTLSVLYQSRLDSLSEASPTNSMLDIHPDIYLFGALMYANGYLANDPRAANFKALWDEAIDSAKQYLTRQKYGAPMVPRVGFVP